VHMVHATPMTPTKRRSRITRGTRLLPGVREQSIMKDTLDAALEHVGGVDYASEMQRLQARRIGCLEAELVFLESKIGEARQAGGEPSQATVDLYLRAAAAQRRHCEVLGWTRTARDVTPSLASVLEAHAKSAKGVPGEALRATGADVSVCIDISCDSADSADIEESADV
jgi:hypothetical protein